MKMSLIGLIVIPSFLVGLLSGCAAPLLAGAALGVGGTAVVYNKQSIEDRLIDSNLCNEILRQLQLRAELVKQSHIEITAYHRVVLLVGQIPTADLRVQAEQIARSVEGVRKLYNAITVESPTPHLKRAQDSWITTKVKSQLLATKDLKSAHFKVLTENGTVYLMGQVSTAQADLAIASTKQVEGVERVVKVFEYV